MAREKILIVEDQGIVATDIKECLIELGYSVVGTASSGAVAIELATELRPNLVLMDIILKGEIDGIAAAGQINEKLQIPVVYLTAHADAATLERAKITAPYGYVLKPFKEIELRTAIELALYNHSVRGASGAAQPTAASPGKPVEKTGKGAEAPVEDTAPEGTLSETEEEALSYLKRMKYFSEIDRSNLVAMAKATRFSSHGSGEFIVTEGDANVSGFVVITGRIAMVKSSATGKDLIVELLPPGDPFGLLATVDRAPYPVNVRTQVKTRLMWIPRNVVLSILDKYPDLSRKFVQEIFDRLRNAHDVSRALAHDRTEVRIASALCSLVPKFCGTANESEPVQIDMTRQELAELTGATTETAIRLTKALERDNVLDLTKAGVMKILDLEALQAVAEQ
ncbi:MAG: response regulator [Bdellovibrionota bacterium]